MNVGVFLPGKISHRGTIHWLSHLFRYAGQKMRFCLLAEASTQLLFPPSSNLHHRVVVGGELTAQDLQNCLETCGCQLLLRSLYGDSAPPASLPQVFFVPHLDYEHPLFEPESGRQLRANLRPGLESALCLLTLSEVTREVLQAHPEYRGQPIVTVPFEIPPAVPGEERAFGQRYLFYPADTLPHKNHSVLIKAFAALERPDVHLLLSGRENPWWMSQSGSLPMGNVHHLGWVHRQRMASLYRDADGVIYLPGYCGAGSGLREALEAGKQTLASDLRQARAIAGPAACYCDPNSTGEVSAGLQRLLGGQQVAASTLEAQRASLQIAQSRGMETLFSLFTRESNSDIHIRI